MLVGIFIGGRSSRMGTAKGLLEAPSGGESLVLRLCRVVSEALPNADVVLVGRNAEYDVLEFEQLADRIEGGGPLAGLVSLLEAGADRGHEEVIALSCDLPFVSASLLLRLATEEREARVLVPRPERFYEAFVARYATSLAGAATRTLEAGELSLQRFIGRASPAILVVDASESRELRDWDTPDDVLRER